MPSIQSAQLAAIEKLTRLLQAGPLEGAALSQAVGLAAEAGEIGATLLKDALQKDAFEPARQSSSSATQHVGPTHGQQPVQGAPDSCHSCGDTTPPQTPYTQVFLGQFVDRERPRDPLVMRFAHLEKGASVWMINRRTHLDADRTDQTAWVKVPWNGELDAEGNANVVVSDDDAMKLGIHSGDVLEIFQTDKAGNVSGSDWVAINEKSPGGRINNPVGRGPTTWIGVQSDAQRPQFLMNADPQPPAANGKAFVQRLSKSNDRWELAITPKKGALALEPFAKVVVDKPPFDAGHYTQDVKRDGSFEVKTWDAGPEDAVVLRVFDHSTSWKMGDGPHATERRVVLAANGKDAVVVDNPAAGTQKKIEASLGRISLSPTALHGEPGAATPGTIVLLVDQSTGKKLTTSVGTDGSFHRTLDAKVGNQISIQLLHAFDAPDRRVDLGIHEVGCDARALAERTPAVGDNKVSARLQVEVAGFDLSFSTYDWNTGNHAALKARTDWSGRVNAVTRYDPNAGEVIVTMSMLVGEGARQDALGVVEGAHTYFGAAGQTSWTNGNNEPSVFRQEIAKRGKGGALPVRFQTEDGHVFQRGTLTIDSVVREHSTGSSQKHHPVWTATLAPGSLVTVP